MHYWYRIGEDIRGPNSPDELREMCRRGDITSDTQVLAADGDASWKRASTILPAPEPTKTTPPVPPPSRPANQTDAVFLDEGGITVTKTRFVAKGQTFALSGITSVRSVEIPPSRGPPIFMLVIGVLLLAGSPVIGIPAVIGAIVWLFVEKPTFSVVLTTAGREATAFTSPDSQFIARVVGALTQAIIARG